MAQNLETMIVAIEAKTEQMRREMRKASGAVESTQKRIDRSLDKADKRFDKFGVGLKNIGALLGVSFGAAGIKNLLLIGDSFDILQDRIKDAIREAGNFDEVWQSLRDSAVDNGTAIEANIALYQRLKPRLADLAATDQQILRLTDYVTKLGIIGGSSVAEMSNGTLQLAQGLGEGIFRAQEFNSVLENMPAVMTAISKSMGKSVSELRKMVIDGQLLSKDVFAAILAQGADIEDRYSKIPPRLSRSWSSFFTAISTQISKINSQLLITESIAQGFDELAIELTPKGELTPKQLRNEIGELSAALYDLEVARAAVGSRTLDPLLGLVPGRIDRDIATYDARIKGLTARRKEYQDLLAKRVKPIDESGGPASLAPIMENFDLTPSTVDPKPISEMEEALNGYQLAISNLEIDVMRSNGNMQGAIQATADLQIAEWEKVAQETPMFAKQAMDAIVLINEKAAADIAGVQEKVNENAKQFAAAFSASFESRGIDALLNGDVSGALQGLVRDFAEMTLRLAVLRPLAEGLFGSLGGGNGGGILGGVGSLFGFANGGTTSVPAMVNERGTESLTSGKGVFIPIGGPATIASASQTRKNAQSSVHVSQYNTFEQPVAPTVRAMLEAVLPEIVNATKGAVLADLGR